MMRFLSWLVTHCPSGLGGLQWDFLLCSMLAWLEVRQFLIVMLCCGVKSGGVSCRVGRVDAVLWFSHNKLIYSCLVLCLNLDRQWEREQFVEPLGAAVCVPELCTDCKPEPVLHVIFTWSAEEVTTRTGQWMERLLHRGDLQPAVTSAC